MATTNYKKLEKELHNLQKEHQLLKEEQIKFKKEQQSKFRRFVVFAVVLCLILSGVSGVASYSLAASDTSYTPKDTTWNTDNAQDAIDELRDNIGASLVGSIFSYMGTRAPYGYLACDGSEYNISDYPRLANHFNSHFGSTNYFGGNGTTTFAVPDLRGEFLRGTGQSNYAGAGPGGSVGEHQRGSIVNGSYADDAYNFGVAKSNSTIGDSPGFSWSNVNQNTFPDKFYSAGIMRYVAGSIYNTGNSSAMVNMGRYTIRPTNTAVLYIIKY